VNFVENAGFSLISNTIISGRACLFRNGTNEGKSHCMMIWIKTCVTWYQEMRWGDIRNLRGGGSILQADDELESVEELTAKLRNMREHLKSGEIVGQASGGEASP
jgi:hypothetical protein